MATTAGGISFQELEGSPKVRFAPQGASATRQFLVAWADYDRFCQELMGVYRDVAGNVAQSKGLPFPGNRDNLFCESCEIEPFDGSNPDGAAVNTLTSGTNAYAGGARVTAHYVQTYDNDNFGGNSPSVQEGTFVTYEADLAAEYVSSPARGWRWDSDSKPAPPDLPIGILDPVGTYTMTWHRVVRPPWSAVSNLRGKVNVTQFFGAAAETLLFVGVRASTQFRINDSLAIWTLSYQFQERLHGGWNFFYRPGAGWERLETADGGSKPYATGDFTALFNYG